MLTGCDVSQWQGNLGPNDLDFVVGKATEGPGWRDPNFLMHMGTAHSRGQLQFAYHFGHSGEGTAGAQNFLAAIAPVVGQLCGVAFDCEFQDAAQSYGPSYADAVAWNNIVAAAYPRLPRYLYTGAFYWVGHIGNPPPLPGTRLWWAHLNGDYNDLDAHRVAAATTKPPLPDLSYPDYAIRQVGWNASIGGQHPVDVNISYLTRQQLAGGQGPGPAPGGDLMASFKTINLNQKHDFNEPALRTVRGLLCAWGVKVDGKLITPDDANSDRMRRGVKQFQHAMGLAADDVIGQATYAKLCLALTR